MKKVDYDELINELKPGRLPDSFPAFYEEWEGQGHIITPEEMERLLGRYELPAEKKQELKRNLSVLRCNEAVCEYIKFLTYVQCDRRYDYYIEDDTDFDLHGIGEVGKTVTFFMCLSCVFHAKKDLEKREIPFELYEDIPHRMLRGQMEKFAKTGSYVFDDLQWQSNFYSLAIYLFDRFLFVPCRLDDPYTFYRRGDEVIAIPDGGLSVDYEGQLILKAEADEELTCDENANNNENNESITSEVTTDKNGEATIGAQNTDKEVDDQVKNGHYYGAFRPDRKEEFVTFKTETPTEITGFRASPCGYITKEKVTLKKSEWKQILKRDDWMIGFHIPSGEGYEPKRVRSSMLLAWNFYKKYYPEIEFKGFWSASWLYDGRLSLLLPQDSRIVRVQRQLFNYSGGWNGEMLYLELFGDCGIPLSEVPQNSSLQRKVAKYFQEGGNFCEPGMVYFPEELSKNYEEMIYITEEDLDKQRQLFERNGLKGVV